jgi:hypothetical protein
MMFLQDGFLSMSQETVKLVTAKRDPKSHRLTGYDRKSKSPANWAITKVFTVTITPKIKASMILAIIVSHETIFISQFLSTTAKIVVLQSFNFLFFMHVFKTSTL